MQGFFLNLHIYISGNGRNSPLRIEGWQFEAILPILFSVNSGLSRSSRFQQNPLVIFFC